MCVKFERPIAIRFGHSMGSKIGNLCSRGPVSF